MQLAPIAGTSSMKTSKRKNKKPKNKKQKTNYRGNRKRGGEKIKKMFFNFFRTYWLNAGDDDAIEDQNNKRVTADMPKLEDQFVNEIYDRMKKEDSENAAMNKKMLFELYLPALRDKGFEVVGTFNEWKKKVRL